MSIHTTLRKLKENTIKKNWSKVYIAIDLHGTVLNSTYNAEVLPDEFYPKAKEVLQYLSKRDDIVLIMYTCSHLDEIEKYQIFFRENGIIFDHVNENPEVQSTPGIGNFSKKPYFQLLLEDKAGFYPLEDWSIIYTFFKENPYFCQKSISGYSCPKCDRVCSEKPIFQTVPVFKENPDAHYHWTEWHQCENCETIYYLHNGT